ncbi:hypothetical protein AGMMS4957_21430 [Bacteroidia bacterium]|nr:hypothetical protein AGMMS4957_21430 [Bacteroidia bacterium]
MYFSHETAIIDDGCAIGEGTKIWHFSHLMGGCTIGENCVIAQNVFIAPDVVLGNGVKVQNNVSIYAGVTCDDDVFLGPSCVFTNVLNPRAAICRKDEFLPTHIGQGATIGANATILCGITIGKFAFVGAGAVVTKNVPDYALVVGNPARQAGWMDEKGCKKQAFYLFFVATLSLFSIQSAYTQIYRQEKIYSKKNKFSFDVVHIIQNDTIKEKTLVLNCLGKEWRSLKTLHPNDSIENRKWTGISWNDLGTDQLDPEKYETTGVKETSESLFLHPPRGGEHAILEFCPFPIVHYPLHVGKRWSWTLIGTNDIYLRAIKNYDKKQGDTSVECEYVVTGEKSWFSVSENKNIPCYVIDATGKTRFGNTKLVAYYSEKYGYVYMHFKTLNKDEYILRLREEKLKTNTMKYNYDSYNHK